MSFESHTLEVKGANFHYQRAGTGPTLLYLHGAGGTPSAMPLMEALSESFDVVVPDHPGFGLSDDPEWLDNIHDVTYYYLTFLEKLDLQDIVVVGSSLGGWIALEIAIRDQSRINKLILSNSAGLSMKDVAMGDNFLWDDEQKVTNLIHGEELQKKILASTPTEEQQEVNNKNHFTTAKLAWEPRFCDPDLEKWLDRITVPTQIVWGDNDKLFPEDYGRYLNSFIPHAEYIVLKDCGHLTHVEKKDELHQEILKFTSEAAA